jgi:OmpA-OmpF porin, OOP family
MIGLIFEFAYFRKLRKFIIKMRKFLLLLLSVIFYSTNSFAQTDLSQLELEYLGKNVNTQYHESAPIISPDGNVLYFFVANHPENNHGGKNSQDIWYSEKDEFGGWKKAVHAPSPLNTHQFNQVMSVLEDGTVLLRGGRKTSEGFSLSKNVNGKFTELVELDVKDYKKMNQGVFSGACFSPDGKVMLLYFSEKKGSKLGDLYVSFHQDGRKWSQPVPLPKNINTQYDEFGPFIAFDNETMYFASTRPYGHGSADIYFTKRLDATWLKWSDPVNVGPPVNTKGFDAYFSIDAQGNAFTTRAFMSADGGSLDILGLKPKDPIINLLAKFYNKKTGEPINGNLSYTYKGDDLVQLKGYDGIVSDTLPGKGKYQLSAYADGFTGVIEDFNIKKVRQDTLIEMAFYLSPIDTRITLKGMVIDEKYQKNLNAKITFGEEGRTIGNTPSDSIKGYEIYLPKAGLFTYSINKEGYLSKNEIIDISYATPGQEIHLDLYLEPVEVGTTVRLNNIFFDFDATTLRSESFPELDKVVKFMIENRTVSIEIAGHTDGKGSDDYNNRLSQGRAESVRKYLISEGVPSTRITAKGYGKLKPIATNDTEEGRQENRRVEFTVLSK